MRQLESFRPSPTPATLGFSILEVLVASAVLAIVLVVLLGTLTTSLSLWRNTEGKMTADREARAAALLLAQDLSGAILPANPSLWPSVSGGVLRFLATKPSDYQEDPDSNLGDVCYFEYSVSGNRLQRRFSPSRIAFSGIRGGSFPNAASAPDVAAFNLLADNRDAVRRMNLASEANRTNFVILVTNNPGNPGELLPLQGAYSASNPPVAVEINLATSDDTALANQELLANTNYVLRNAGLFSFRVGLPRPMTTP